MGKHATFTVLITIVALIVCEFVIADGTTIRDIGPKFCTSDADCVDWCSIQYAVCATGSLKLGLPDCTCHSWTCTPPGLKLGSLPDCTCH